jgi:hypothetical protein
MPDDRDDRLAELRRLRLGDILYPGTPAAPAREVAVGRPARARAR